MSAFKDELATRNKRARKSVFFFKPACNQVILVNSLDISLDNADLVQENID